MLRVLSPIIRVIFFLFLFPLSALADRSWDNAIGIVSEKSARYYDYALVLGAGHPGSALHGIGHQMHICAIAGRMLGFRKEIAQAETFNDPPLLPSTDPSILMEHSLFLDSWVAAAKRAIAMTERQRKSLWNLECLGNYGIPNAALIMDPSLNSDFSVREKTLVIYGDIESGFHKRFLEMLEANPEIEYVALGSAGGSVSDALLSGMEIRKRGLATTLHGPCFSACPLIFIGGERRDVWMGPGPHLGFHRVYTASGELPMEDSVYRLIEEYLVAMGVDPIPVLGWMARAGSSEIFEPGLKELCEPRVATWVQRICF